ncbi:MAG: putative metalloprotease CJM1_0395 family protein [Verrucomicrobiae bacterium]|nr:putative metalloprotease CJM1_0395 family protein [Verrucomicrobiae bacterium]
MRMVNGISGGGVTTGYLELAGSRGVAMGSGGDAAVNSRDGVEAKQTGTGVQGQQESDQKKDKPVSKTGDQAQESLDSSQKKQVQELKRRDVEVRAHEAAHVAAGGSYVRGGARFTYQMGPDGRNYAIGGEVSFDSGKESDPQKTIAKAQTIRNAAMAPVNPSSQDFSVAASMTALEVDARKDLQEEKKLAGKEGDGQPPRTEGASEIQSGKETSSSRTFGTGSQSGDDEGAYRKASDVYQRQSRNVAGVMGGFNMLG